MWLCVFSEMKLVTSVFRNQLNAHYAGMGCGSGSDASCGSGELPLIKALVVVPFVTMPVYCSLLYEGSTDCSIACRNCDLLQFLQFRGVLCFQLASQTGNSPSNQLVYPICLKHVRCDGGE